MVWNVAIIDDMLPNAMLAESVLEQLPDVGCALYDNGVDALVAFAVDCPDLIVTDHLMPHINGIEFIRQFREMYPDTFVPILMVTGDTSKDVLQQALETGATDFVRKPFDDIELKARVSNLLQLKKDRQALERVNRELQVQASTDPLTGASNRRAFLNRGKEEEERCKRYGSSFSFMMLDIDNFKTINDTYGHDVGDQVLVQLVAELQNLLRTSDHVGRLGGEEFAILFAGISDDRARDAAQRVIDHIQGIRIALPAGKTLSFTASAGVAFSTGENTQLDDMLKIADKRLYAAKKAGKNKVVLADPMV
jgi:diguanylate cyclase (GGDEF)-like protein